MSDIKILYVEDAKSSGGTLRKALKDAHMNVVYVGGGFDALDELSDGGADVVVSCIELGDLPGYQLASLIKSSPTAANMPVVLFGAAGYKADPESFWDRACRADAFYSAEDLESDSAKAVVTKIKELVESSRKNGFDRQKSKNIVASRPSFTSGNMMESTARLIDDLLLQQSAQTVARKLASHSDSRSKFIDTLFDALPPFDQSELAGFLVAHPQGAWGSFKPVRGANVSQAMYKKLLDRLTTELELRSEPQIDLRGDLIDGGAKEFGSVQILPVSRGGQLLAVLVFACKDKNAFSDQALAFNQLLSQEMATPLELLLSKEALQEMHSREATRASIDSLTGLYNLEFLVGFLQQQLLFSFRQRLPVAVAIIDVDEFSRANLDHGYEFGDSALMTIANRLLHITRSSDLIARYGGDQFAVVLPNTDVAGAKVLAEKVRSEVETLSFDVNGGKPAPKLTVSVGYASFNMEDLNPETILRDAKLALRAAKEQGRNRTESAS